MMHRRSLLTGMLGLIAAPAIVRASSLMPVRAWRDLPIYTNGSKGQSAKLTIDGYEFSIGDRVLWDLGHDPRSGVYTVTAVTD